MVSLEGGAMKYMFKKGLAGSSSGPSIYANPYRMFPSNSATQPGGLCHDHIVQLAVEPRQSGEGEGGDPHGECAAVGPPAQVLEPDARHDPAQIGIHRGLVVQVDAPVCCLCYRAKKKKETRERYVHACIFLKHTGCQSLLLQVAPTTDSSK